MISSSCSRVSGTPPRCLSSARGSDADATVWPPKARSPGDESACRSSCSIVCGVPDPRQSSPSVRRNGVDGLQLSQRAPAANLLQNSKRPWGNPGAPLGACLATYLNSPAACCASHRWHQVDLGRARSFEGVGGCADLRMPGPHVALIHARSLRQSLSADCVAPPLPMRCRTCLTSRSRLSGRGTLSMSVTWVRRSSISAFRSRRTAPSSPSELPVRS